MCRSIQTLRQADSKPSPAEIEAAALQYVRKISGYRKPSRANQAAFEQAVQQVAAATQALLDGFVATPQVNSPQITRKRPA